MLIPATEAQRAGGGAQKSGHSAKLFSALNCSVLTTALSSCSMVARKLELRDLKIQMIKVNIWKQVQMLHAHCYLLPDIIVLKQFNYFCVHWQMIKFTQC